MCELMIGLQLQPKVLPGSIKKRIESSSILEVQQNGDLAQKSTRILMTTISKVHTIFPNIYFLSYEIWTHIRGFKRVFTMRHFINIFFSQKRLSSNKKYFVYLLSVKTRAGSILINLICFDYLLHKGFLKIIGKSYVKP